MSNKTDDSASVSAARPRVQVNETAPEVASKSDESSKSAPGAVAELLRDSGFVVAVITAFTATVGWSYRRGYMRHFGVPDSLLPVALENMLIDGYQAWEDITQRGVQLIIAYSLSCFLLIAAVFALLGWISNKSRDRRIQRKLKKAEALIFDTSGKPLSQGEKLLDWMVERFYAGTISIAIVITILVAIKWTAGIGEEVAATRSRQLQDKVYSGAIEVSYKLDSDSGDAVVKVVALLVASSDKYLAFFDGTKTQIVAHERILMIRTLP